MKTSRYHISNFWSFPPAVGADNEGYVYYHDSPRYRAATADQLAEWFNSDIELVRHAAATEQAQRRMKNDLNERQDRMTTAKHSGIPIIHREAKWHVNESHLKTLVKALPVVQDACEIIAAFKLYLEQGFMDEFREKLKRGVADHYLKQMEMILHELK